VGHAGTLDPPATGVLLVGLGRATRLLRFLQELEKAYEATVGFGVTTSTQDATGEVLERRPCTFGARELHAASLELVGDIEQVPPMVSAVKVGGEPLYRAARRGEVVPRAPRPVRVYELSVSRFDPGRGTAAMRVRCSSGTYVRTLAADLGERLGCGAHLTSLRRVAIGSFGEPDAVRLDDLEPLGPDDRLARVLPMPAAMRDFRAIVAGGPALEGVRNGRSLDPADPAVSPAGGTGPEDGPVAVLDPQGDLVAVYDPVGGRLRAAAVLAPAGAPGAAVP
ncbi:MAG: tRNA pseudouridine(55) synthase TruB, partial [Actinomycetota bacterium]